MKYPGGTILLLTIVLLAGGADAAAQPRVYAKIESDTTIYPGQVFAYSVVVEGGATPSRIDASPLAAFNPVPGQSGQTMRSINGRTTISYSKSYMITAEEPGTMVLPGVTVVVDGKTYTTNEVKVTVAEPGTTDRLDLEVTLSESKCYVGQPIVMTVRWIIKAQVQNGAFDVPVFRTDDFFIEDLPDSSNALARQQTSIDGVPVVLSENRETIEGLEAAVISFRKILLPKRVRDHHARSADGGGGCGDRPRPNGRYFQSDPYAVRAFLGEVRSDFIGGVASARDGAASRVLRPSRSVHDLRVGDTDPGQRGRSDHVDHSDWGQPIPQTRSMARTGGGARTGE